MFSGMVQHFRLSPGDATRNDRHLWRLSDRIMRAAMASLVLFLAQCSHPPDPSDSLALMVESQLGCAAPCWLGIVPGMSTEANVLEAGEANAERFDDLKRNGIGSQLIQYRWRDPVLGGLMSLELESDIVTHIRAQTETDIGLQLAFDEFGMPDAYATYLSTGERLVVILFLFYTSRGIVIEAQLPASQVQIVCCHYDLPDSPVIQRWYMWPPAIAETTLLHWPPPFPRGLSPFPWLGPSGLELSACQS